MKNLLILALTLIAITTAKAGTPTVKESSATITIIVSHADVQAPATNPAEEQTPATAPTAVGAPDNSAKYVGTNDLNLYLLRQGIKRA